MDIPGGHKLIPYKPSDAVEGEIAIIERILAGRIRSNAKVLSSHQSVVVCLFLFGYQKSNFL